jgi:hypothetical protein
MAFDGGPVRAQNGARLPRPCAALRQAWAEGYTLRHLRGDTLAGLVVGSVALPLSMALAGVLLMLLGLARPGRPIQFVPFPPFPGRHAPRPARSRAPSGRACAPTAASGTSPARCRTASIWPRGCAVQHRPGAGRDRKSGISPPTRHRGLADLA